MDGKKVIVNIDSGNNVVCKEWKYTGNKVQVIFQSKCVGELLEGLVNEWDIVLGRVAK